eukprot:s4945_g10.t1
MPGLSFVSFGGRWGLRVPCFGRVITKVLQGEDVVRLQELTDWLTANAKRNMYCSSGEGRPEELITRRTAGDLSTRLSSPDGSNSQQLFG